LAHMRPNRKSGRLTSFWSFAVKNDRTTFLVLRHEARVLEVRNQRIFALNAGVRNVAHFFTVEFVPLAVVKFLIKAHSEFRLQWTEAFFGCTCWEYS